MRSLRRGGKGDTEKSGRWLKPRFSSGKKKVKNVGSAGGRGALDCPKTKRGGLPPLLLLFISSLDLFPPSFDFFETLSDLFSTSERLQRGSHHSAPLFPSSTTLSRHFDPSTSSLSLSNNHSTFLKSALPKLTFAHHVARPGQQQDGHHHVSS